MENADNMRGGIYNAGGNNLNFSKLEIAHIIQKKQKFNIIDSELKDKDLRHFQVNYDKIEKLGFKPQKDIEYGVEEMIKIFSFYEYYSHYKTI
jgi:nucleoside-diphosphate-sugar epimerase